MSLVHKERALFKSLDSMPSRELSELHRTTIPHGSMKTMINNLKRGEREIAYIARFRISTTLIAWASLRDMNDSLSFPHSPYTEIGIYVASSHRRKGYGKALALRAKEEFYLGNFPLLKSPLFSRPWDSRSCLFYESIEICSIAKHVEAIQSTKGGM